MRSELIRTRAQQAISEKVFPGCVVGVVARDGPSTSLRASIREIFPFGNFTYAEDSPRVKEDTVYDLASVTKSIPVASLALALIAEEKLRLSDTVVSYVPLLQNDFGATIEDLLQYRVQGIQLSKLQSQTFEEIRTHALEHGFNAPPGEFIYTNLPAFILGIVLERASGESLAVLAHRYLFEPLHMDATTFFPSASDCAPTEIDSRGEVRGLPHDESTYRFALARRTVGHAGLFSTAPDLLNFLEALLQGNYAHIVDGAQHGLGWQTAGDFLGTHASAGAFGKTGFTGTSVVCDMEKGIGLVILSNRTYPKRPLDSSAINTFRADIADIVNQM